MPGSSGTAFLLPIDRKEIKMTVYAVKDKEAISGLFSGWEETMIWSCLQDCMGVAEADDLYRPLSAQIRIGGFRFLAGEVNPELIRSHTDSSFEILVPQNREWEKAIEDAHKNNVRRRIRYATKKEKNAFNIPRLQEIAAGLPAPYQFRRIDGTLYEKIMVTDWTLDLCANFKDSRDYIENGLGVVIVKAGEIVSGASSYTYYNDGIEVQIDTREDERRKGLALACGAKLILECLERNLYPSWDAHNPGSLALAEKLGYRFDKEYPVYEYGDEED